MINENVPYTSRKEPINQTEHGSNASPSSCTLSITGKQKFLLNSPATWSRSSAWWDWWTSRPVTCPGSGKSWSQGREWLCFRKCTVAPGWRWAGSVLNTRGKTFCTHTVGTATLVRLYNSSCCLGCPFCWGTLATWAQKHQSTKPTGKKKKNPAKLTNVNLNVTESSEHWICRNVLHVTGTDRTPTIQKKKKIVPAPFKYIF